MRLGEPMPQVQVPTSRPDNQGHREKAKDDIPTLTVRQQERINLIVSYATFVCVPSELDDAHPCQ